MTTEERKAAALFSTVAFMMHVAPPAPPREPWPRLKYILRAIAAALLCAIAEKAAPDHKTKAIALVASVGITLGIAGCNGPTAPIVDLAGVNMGQYSRDLAACHDDLNASPITFGDALGRCMTAKGYTVLYPH